MCASRAHRGADGATKARRPEGEVAVEGQLEGADHAMRRPMTRGGIQAPRERQIIGVRLEACQGGGELGAGGHGEPA